MNDRVTELRKKLSLSQAEFSEKLGISRTGLSDVESGRRPVQERHIRLILAAFPQVSERWLRSGEGEMMDAAATEVPDIVRKYSFEDIVAKLLQTYEELDADDQETVLRYAQRFIGKVMAGATADQAAAEMDRAEPEELDIDQEVERYREQLIAQKIAASSLSGGTAGTGKSAG